MTAHLIRMAAIESEVESLRGQVAGLTAELEDQRAITRAVFADLNRTFDVIRDAISHLDAGEHGIARRTLRFGIARDIDKTSEQGIKA